MRHVHLEAAKKAKNDEFYTRIEDVEAELWHYRDHFRDKTVYLNCDDPRWSSFWRYFCLRFGELGLEKLIATHYTGVTEPGQPSFKIEALRGRDDTSGDGVKYVDPETGGVQTALEGDGDFRSEECIELLDQSDIVVTNPPFSLLREYVSQLVEYGKEFLVIGNMNVIGYKEIWPLIQAGDLWLGVQRPKRFIVGDTMPDKAGQTINQSGKREQAFGNILWFTNLDHAKRHEELPLWKHYTPEEYPKYDNYDAINVDKVKEIPRDYGGVMGVPISFLDKYNPDQFEIVQFRHGDDGKDLRFDGKRPYSRILIRHRNPELKKEEDI